MRTTHQYCSAKNYHVFMIHMSGHSYRVSFQPVTSFFHGHVLHNLINKIYSKLPCYDLKKFKPMYFCRSKCTKKCINIKSSIFAMVSDLMFHMYWSVPVIFLNNASMASSDNMFHKVHEMVLPAVLSSWNYLLSKKLLKLLIATCSIQCKVWKRYIGFFANLLPKHFKRARIYWDGVIFTSLVVSPKWNLP